MHRKRIIALLLSLSIFVSAVACGKNEEVELAEQNAPEPVKMVDMTSPEPDPDYGRIYYTPVEEAHIAPLDNQGIVQYVDNEILLVAQPGTSRSEVDALAKRYDTEIVGEIEITGDYQLRLHSIPALDVLQTTLEQLRAEEIVYSAELNYAMPSNLNKEGTITTTIPFEDIPFTNEQAMELWNGEGAWGFRAIHAEEAQKTLHEAINEPPYIEKPVRIGLIDVIYSGTQNDLGFSEVFYTTQADPGDKFHGFHVAGTMAAKTGNDFGIDGVYPYGDQNLFGVDLVGVCEYTENGDPFETVMAHKIAFSELIVRNVKVINESWGIGGNTPLNNKQVEQAARGLGDFLNRMLRNGYDFVIVNSAGNESTQLSGHLESKFSSWVASISEEEFPDVYDRIIIVGALDPNLNICDFSNGGKRTDIYAPGKSILSTISDNYFIAWDGTSMAAPHVSGVAAMVWTANHKLTGAQVKQIICTSTNDQCTSCKMIDAQKAVLQALTRKGDGDEADPQSGGILGFVVNKDNADERIENAGIGLTNTATGFCYEAVTDDQGHFEITLPEGDYSLTVIADGFRPYESEKPIHVSSQEITYPDWIKLTRDGNDTDSDPALNWIVQPTIEADNILLGDHYVGSPYYKTDYLRPAYIVRDDKYGFIDYTGKIVVEPTYGGSNAYFDGLTCPSPATYWGLDLFPALYDFNTGDTVFIEHTEGIDGWKLREEKNCFGQPGIGTYVTTYFINTNDDNQLYKYCDLDEKAEYYYGGVDASYVVQDIAYKPGTYGLTESTVVDPQFYLYTNAGIEGKELTDRYPYVYMNGSGTCSLYIPSYIEPGMYQTVAFSRDRQKWDLFDYCGNLITSDLEPFACNIFSDQWWSPASDIVNHVDAAHFAVFGMPAPFCATEGYIAAKKDGKCGYLDIHGNTVIDFGVLEDVRPVHYGKAWAKYKGKWGVLSFPDAS